MDLQEKMFEECCTMMAYMQKNQKNIPSDIEIMMKVATKNRHPEDLQKLHIALQEVIAPARLENIVEKIPFFSMVLATVSLGTFITGLMIFIACTTFSLNNSHLKQDALLGVALVANALYILSELKVAFDNYSIDDAIITGLWLRLGIGIFASIVMVETIFVEAHIMQNPHFISTFFVFAFPFSIYHSWDFLCVLIEKIFFCRAKQIDLQELITKEIVVLHKYSVNSTGAHFQCCRIQQILKKYELLDNIDLLEKYSKENTQEYLKLLLYTRFIANNEEIPKKEISNKDSQFYVDNIVDGYIQKTLSNLRENNMQGKDEKNDVVFEEEFICIRDKKNDTRV